MDTKHWLYLTQHFESPFKGLVGGAFKLKQACEKLGSALPALKTALPTSRNLLSFQVTINGPISIDCGIACAPEFEFVSISVPQGT